jgi:hypothetical protein
MVHIQQEEVPFRGKNRPPNTEKRACFQIKARLSLGLNDPGYDLLSHLLSQRRQVYTWRGQFYRSGYPLNGFSIFESKGRAQAGMAINKSLPRLLERQRIQRPF